MNTISRMQSGNLRLEVDFEGTFNRMSTNLQFLTSTKTPLLEASLKAKPFKPTLKTCSTSTGLTLEIPTTPRSRKFSSLDFSEKGIVQSCQSTTS